MYPRENVFSPMLVVCLLEFDEISEAVRGWKKSNRKDKTGKKNVAERIPTHVTHFELCY